MRWNLVCPGIYVFTQEGFVKESEQINDAEKGIDFKTLPDSKTQEVEWN